MSATTSLFMCDSCTNIMEFPIGEVPSECDSCGRIIVLYECVGTEDDIPKILILLQKEVPDGA
jgi:hypothetical protein